MHVRRTSNFCLVGRFSACRELFCDFSESKQCTNWKQCAKNRVAGGSVAAKRLEAFDVGTEVGLGLLNDKGAMVDGCGIDKLHLGGFESRVDAKQVVKDTSPHAQRPAEEQRYLDGVVSAEILTSGFESVRCNFEIV